MGGGTSEYAPDPRRALLVPLEAEPALSPGPRLLGAVRSRAVLRCRFCLPTHTPRPGLINGRCGTSSNWGAAQRCALCAAARQARGPGMGSERPWPTTLSSLCPSWSPTPCTRPGGLGPATSVRLWLLGDAGQVLILGLGCQSVSAGLQGRSSVRREPAGGCCWWRRPVLSGAPAPALGAARRSGRSSQRREPPLCTLQGGFGPDSQPGAAVVCGGGRASPPAVSPPTADYPRRRWRAGPGSARTVGQLERQARPVCRGRTLARLAAALGTQPTALMPSPR